MFNKIFTKLTMPFVKWWILKKHGGIWGLKSYLRENGGQGIALKVYNDYFAQYGGWISYGCEMKGVPCFPHEYFGIFISLDAKIGKNVVIFQQVTIGSNSLADSSRRGSPVIGDNVYIGAGAKIIGNIKIGDNCRIGANAVVYQDMPAHSVAVLSPTRILQKQDLDNRFYAVRSDSVRIYYSDGEWVKDD